KGSGPAHATVGPDGRVLHPIPPVKTEFSILITVPELFTIYGRATGAGNPPIVGTPPSHSSLGTQSNLITSKEFERPESFPSSVLLDAQSVLLVVLTLTGHSKSQFEFQSRSTLSRNEVNRTLTELRGARSASVLATRTAGALVGGGARMMGDPFKFSL